MYSTTYICITQEEKKEKLIRKQNKQNFLVCATSIMVKQANFPNNVTSSSHNNYLNFLLFYEYWESTSSSRGNNYVYRNYKTNILKKLKNMIFFKNNILVNKEERKKILMCLSSLFSAARDCFIVYILLHERLFQTNMCQLGPGEVARIVLTVHSGPTQ